MYSLDVAAVIRNDNVDILKSLRPVTVVKGDPILHYCVQYRAVRCVNFLISQNRVNVNELDFRGYPAIFYACMDDNFLIFLILLENGAKIDYIIGNQNIFTRLLSERGNPACLKYLLYRITKRAKIPSGDNELLQSIVFNALVDKIKHSPPSIDQTERFFYQFLFEDCKTLKSSLKNLQQMPYEKEENNNNNVTKLKLAAYKAFVSNINYYPKVKKNIHRNYLFFRFKDFLF